MAFRAFQRVTKILLLPVLVGNNVVLSFVTDLCSGQVVHIQIQVQERTFPDDNFSM